MSLNRYTIGAFVAVFALVVTTARADQRSRPSDAEIVGPLLDDTMIAVIKLQPDKIDVEKGLERLADEMPEAEHLNQWARAHLPKLLADLRAGTQGNPMYILLNGRRPGRGFTFPNAVKEVPFLSDYGDGDIVCVIPDAEGNVPALAPKAPVTPRPELAAAFEAVQEYPVQVLFLPPPHAEQTVEELMPELPDYLGGGPSTLLTDGLRWAALGVDPANASIEVVIQSGSPDAAKAFAKRLPIFALSLYMLATGRLGEEEPTPVLAALAIAATPTEVQGDRIFVHITQETLPEEIRAKLAEFLFHGPLSGTADKMKQIMIAMHNYHDTHKCFPPIKAARDDSGRPYLSWRVHILPYLNQLDLYSEFHHTEPWDSPHNKRLLEKMPTIYRTLATAAKPGHTTLLAPVGEGTLFGRSEALSMRHITDGTSNTIALVEVRDEKAAPWTAPDDFAFDPEAPEAGIARDAQGVTTAAWFDGSVRRFALEENADQLLLLFQIDDGQPIDMQ